VLVVDETTAPYVREAFRMLASGESTARSLAVWVASLPDEARGAETSMDQPKRARRMHPHAVRMILTAPVYVGRFSDGSQGRWEPLLDVSIWDSAQARLAARAGKPGPCGGEHLLTGLIRCADCGARMGGWKKDKWRRYRCSAFMKNGQRSVRECGATVTAPILDDAVLTQVTALLAPLAEQNAALTRALTRIWEQLRRPNDPQAQQRRQMIVKARRDAEDARRRIGNATRLLIDGTIDKVAYDALVADEQRRLNSAEESLNAPAIQEGVALPPLADVLGRVGGWTTVLSTGPIPEQRDMLAVLIERVLPRRVSFGRYTAEVTWTELGKALQEMAIAA